MDEESIEKSLIVLLLPYNLKIKYGNYDDSVPRKDYLSDG